MEEEGEVINCPKCKVAITRFCSRKCKKKYADIIRHNRKTETIKRLQNLDELGVIKKVVINKVKVIEEVESIRKPLEDAPDDLYLIRY